MLHDRLQHDHDRFLIVLPHHVPVAQVQDPLLECKHRAVHFSDISLSLLVLLLLSRGLEFLQLNLVVLRVEVSLRFVELLDCVLQLL